MTWTKEQITPRKDINIMKKYEVVGTSVLGYHELFFVETGPLLVDFVFDSYDCGTLSLCIATYS